MVKSSAWTLGKIATEVGGTLSPAANPDSPVADFQVRAWSCRKGSVLLSLKYETLLEGGNTMVARAIGRGAVAAVVESEEGLSDDIPFILVEDLDRAARRLAEVSRAKFEGMLIGITGTAGKSSVKAMLGHILQQVGDTWVTASNQNLTPHIIANLPEIGPELDFAVMEIALFRPNTVRDSALLARPHVAVITSIGLGHAEDFEDPHMGILHAKADLFKGLEPGGIAVLPRFSDRFEELLELATKSDRVEKIITCGTSEDDHVQLTKVETNVEHRRATIAVGGEEVSFDVPYLGEHMVENATMVVGALVAAGLPISVMRLVSSAPPPHSAANRYKLVYKGKTVELVDDSFNTGPLAVRAMANAASKRTDKRKLLLICDVGGLEEKRDEVHASMAPCIDAANFAHIFTVGDATKKMAEKLQTPTTSYGNRFVAVKELQKTLKDRDLVFVKGSAAMGFKDVTNHLKKSSTSMERVGTDWVG